jgi:hypothetical protein
MRTNNRVLEDRDGRGTPPWSASMQGKEVQMGSSRRCVRVVAAGVLVAAMTGVGSAAAAAPATALVPSGLVDCLPEPKPESPSDPTPVPPTEPGSGVPGGNEGQSPDDDGVDPGTGSEQGLQIPPVTDGSNSTISSATPGAFGGFGSSVMATIALQSAVDAAVPGCAKDEAPVEEAPAQDPALIRDPLTVPVGPVADAPVTSESRVLRAELVRRPAPARPAPRPAVVRQAKPQAKPQLAETGIDTTGLLAIAGGAVVLGGGLLGLRTALRRRNSEA